MTHHAEALHFILVVQCYCGPWYWYTDEDGSPHQIYSIEFKMQNLFVFIALESFCLLK